MTLLKDLVAEAEAKYGYYQAMPKNKEKKYRMSGFYWVGKTNSKTKKGYTFKYQIRRNHKITRFTRMDLRELKREVDNRGLPWRISNELLARKLVSDEGLDWEDFKDERQ